MPFEHLPEDQSRRAEELSGAIRAASDSNLETIAESLATQPDHQLFGAAEFALRDLVHRFGAKALQAAAEQRKKGGMSVPA